MKTQEMIQEISKAIANETRNIKDKGKRTHQVFVIMGRYYGKIKYEFAGELPAKGANGAVTELKDRYRIQYRCGYSKHNYAPCIEIFK